MPDNAKIASFLAFVSLSLAVAGGAQEHLVRLNGVYLYDPLPADRRRIEQAIEETVSQLGMLKRGIARNRLRQSTQPLPRFQVHFETQRVLLRLHRHEFELPLNGRVVRAVGLAGDEVQASVHIRGNTLHQTLESAQGTRYHEFHFRQDGSVSVGTRIESEHLPQRISYNLTYHRAP